MLERLRVALAPGIVVERELARGGMGIVLLGRDAVLDRPVAIKTIAPDHTTAVLAERFVREAQSTARLAHPNIVVVHKWGIADGLPYYTMDYFPEGTLKARLARGKLSARRVVRLGRELLSALSAAHRGNIVHRDVKPGNIFFRRGEALLADFGVAYLLDTTETALTETGMPVGTRGYMAPEQFGDRVTPAADLYSVGLVLLEAATGEQWDQRGLLRDSKIWPRIPAHLRPALERALMADPKRRWQSAEEFARALADADRHGSRARLARRAGITLAAFGIGIIAVLLARRFWVTESSDISLTVFPFDAGVPNDSALGTEISGSAAFYLERMPGVVLTHLPAAARAWHGSSLGRGERLPHLATRLGTSYGVSGVVRRRATALEAEVDVVDSAGILVGSITVRGDSGDRWSLGDAVGAEVVRVVLGRLPEFEKVHALAGVSRAAWPAFFAGERAFARGAWRQAERQYSAAFAADTGFVLAAWRLGNVRRWLVIDPAFPAGFADLYRRRRGSVPEADRRLIEAQLAPAAAERFERYAEAMKAAGGDAYAALLYGDELFHRGPLAGRPLREAVEVLKGAIAQDSGFAPAWEHLAWALIRLGDRAAAETALVHLREVAGRPEDYGTYLPPLLGVAHAMRFGTAAPRSAADPLMRSSETLALAARGALAFDVATAERMLGAALASSPAPASLRASGRTGEGLALVALGRPNEALARFDDVASLLPGRLEPRLHAAEWRVIPPALGAPGFSAHQAERGREALAAIAGDSILGHRAAWALAVDAIVRGDSAAYQVWSERVRRSVAAEALVPALEALALATAGNLEQAVAAVTPAMAYDSAGLAPDPFLRSLVHLMRGDWLARLGRSADADRDWLWYENTDAIGWPHADTQPAEVDWALSTWARWKRAELARSSGNGTAACGFAYRVLEIWSRPEPALDSLTRSAASLAAECRA